MIWCGWVEDIIGIKFELIVVWEWWGIRWIVFFFIALLLGSCVLWIFGLFGVSWVMPRSVLDLLECWQGNFGRHRNIDIWRAVRHCLMWCLWREYDARSFEDCERSTIEIKLLFLRTLFDWVAAWGLFLVHLYFSFWIYVLYELDCFVSLVYF